MDVSQESCSSAYVMTIYLVFHLKLPKAVDGCSYSSLFDYRYAFRPEEYKYDYKKQNIENLHLPEEAKEEAVMLIGGK